MTLSPVRCNIHHSLSHGSLAHVVLRELRALSLKSARAPQQADAADAGKEVANAEKLVASAQVLRQATRHRTMPPRTAHARSASDASFNATLLLLYNSRDAN